MVTSFFFGSILPLNVFWILVIDIIEKSEMIKNEKLSSKYVLEGNMFHFK